MKILIIEDEKMAAHTLKRMLLQVAPESDIVSILSSVKEATKYLISEPELDLIILDIHLADGSAFELLEKVSPDAPIVFATAYDHYAIRAFELNSLDYILKPVSLKRLQQTMNRLKQQKILTGESAIKQLSSVLKNLKGQEDNFKNRFLIKGGSRLIPIEVHQIAYFYRDQESLFLVTFKGNTFIVNYSLEALENLLDPGVFFRLNRQVIINFSALADIQNYFNGKLKVTLNPAAPFEVFVSQERSKSFQEWLET